MPARETAALRGQKEKEREREREGDEKSMVNRCRAYRVVKQLVNIQSTYAMHNVVVCTERAYVPET